MVKSLGQVGAVSPRLRTGGRHPGQLAEGADGVRGEPEKQQGGESTGPGAGARGASGALLGRCVALGSCFASQSLSLLICKMGMTLPLVIGHFSGRT